MRRVCVVSGSRADYGLLYWPMKKIQNQAMLELVTIVTGMHLSTTYGYTAAQFSIDGFPVTDQVDMLTTDNSEIAVTKSLGRAVIGFAEAYEKVKPDIVLLLGDRYEIFAAAQAALIANIPVAHMFGGDTTEGAIDESIRHSITKMAHLHFVSNELSAKRVCQMGENSENVYVVGSTGLDAIRQAKLLSRDVFFEAIDFKPENINFLVTFHPVTLGLMSSKDQLLELLQALNEFPDYGLIFTKANSDAGGKELNQIIDAYVACNTKAKAFDVLGEHYLSALSNVDLVVGNSSSGLYEAPSFGVATINIGDRQKGRMKAASVINCSPDKISIMEAIKTGLLGDYSNIQNPFGDGHASEKICQILSSISEPKALLQKHFFMSD